MRVLEIFAGAGGASMGLERAGCYLVLGVEWDPDAVATARAAGHPTIRGDVRDLSLYAGLEDVDLVWSSFPCQAWSSAGGRAGARDDRNGWPWTVAALDAVRPTWVVAENVPGLLCHTRRSACLSHRGSIRAGGWYRALTLEDCSVLVWTVDLEALPAELELSGRAAMAAVTCPADYFELVILAQLRRRYAWVGHVELDAYRWGVPQFRRRIYIVAGPRAIRWPTPTHGSPSECRQGSLFAPPLRPWVTVREALGLDRLAERNSGVRGLTEVPVNAPCPTVPAGSHRDNGFRVPTEHKGTRADHQRGGPDRASDALWLATGRRRLTVTECAILMGWPADYPLAGNKTTRYRQVGNGCCPQVVEALVRQIIEADRE